MLFTVPVVSRLMNPVPVFESRYRHGPGIPQPGTESSKDALIQTEPQRATAETEQSVEDPTTVDPKTQGITGTAYLGRPAKSEGSQNVWGQV